MLSAVKYTLQSPHEALLMNGFGFGACMKDSAKECGPLVLLTSTAFSMKQS